MWYRVRHEYASGLISHLGGVWRQGQMVDLTDAMALAIEVDSPGALVVVPGYRLPDPGEPEGETVFDPEPQDRMLRKPGRKRAAA